MGWEEADISAFAVGLGLAVEFADPSTLDPRERDKACDQLRAWSNQYRTMTVSIPDATRPLPEGMLRSCLEALHDKELKIIVGVGLHRAPNEEEWQRIPQLREAAASGLEVVWTGGLWPRKRAASPGDSADSTPED